MPGVVRCPRPKTLLLAAVVGACGFLGSTGKNAACFPAVASQTSADAMAAVPADRVVWFETPESAVAEETSGSTVAAAPGERRVEQLSAGDAALFAATCDLQLLAADAELDLTSRQWTALAAAVVQAQAVRHHYEAEIAVAHEIAPGRYRLEIPAYAEAGDELRRRFRAELEESLGRNTTAEVMEKLGARLEARFAGFGVGVQTLEIIGDPAAAPADVEVRRTAHYWNSVQGADRVTTRRECHFPAAEDPTGEGWNALLALTTRTS
jgi:hypothetical protein